MKLKFVGRPHLMEYHGHTADGERIDVLDGGTVNVPDDVGRILLTHFTGMFFQVVEYEPQAQDISAPVVDRQIKRPAVRKGSKR